MSEGPVEIVEVFPRDGLRNEKATVCAGADLAWMRQQFDASRAARTEQAMALARRPKSLNEIPTRADLIGNRPTARRGRPRCGDRVALAGIVFVLRSGIPWEMLPAENRGGDCRTPGRTPHAIG